MAMPECGGSALSHANGRDGGRNQHREQLNERRGSRSIASVRISGAAVAGESIEDRVELVRKTFCCRY